MKFFKTLFNKPLKYFGSWFSVADGVVTVHTDRAYDKISPMLHYTETTQWRIGVMRRCILIYLQKAYPGYTIEFDLGTKYRLGDFPVGTEIHWAGEYEKIKDMIDG